MKQALGRARRQGQQAKYVYVYYFLMAYTPDVDIIEKRTGKIVELIDDNISRSKAKVITPFSDHRTKFGSLIADDYFEDN